MPSITRRQVLAGAPAVAILPALPAFVVHLGLHYRWRAALGAAFISGCCCLPITLRRLRHQVFDAPASLMGNAHRAGLMPDRNPVRFGRTLMADGSAIFLGALLGISSTTAYREGAAGVEDCGRTGLAALTAAV